MSKYPLPKSVATSIKELSDKLDDLEFRLGGLEKASLDPANPENASLTERVKDLEDILWGDNK